MTSLIFTQLHTRITQSWGYKAHASLICLDTDHRWKVCILLSLFFFPLFLMWDRKGNSELCGDAVFSQKNYEEKKKFFKKEDKPQPKSKKWLRIAELVWKYFTANPTTLWKIYIYISAIKSCKVLPLYWVNYQKLQTFIMDMP